MIRTTTERQFKVGDKVRTFPGGPIGVVREIDPVGMPKGCLDVAWPVPGKAFPIRRIETLTSVVLVRSEE